MIPPVPRPTRSLLTQSLHAREAVPTAGAVGAAVGAAFAVAFQGISNTVPGMLFGSVLGMGWVALQRHMERADARALPAHERALADYPAVRQLLRRAGTDVQDVAALTTLAARLEADFALMTERFTTYCDDHDLVPHPLIGSVIRHFYLTHCGDRGIALLCKSSVRVCYLVAAHTVQYNRISAAVNDTDAPAGTVLRRLRCPYLRVDLANETLRDALSFATEEHYGEMRVHPVMASPREGPSVAAGNPQHRRQRQPPPVEPTETAPSRTTHLATVTRSPQLQDTLARLQDRRVWSELKKIEGDLAQGRSRGHHIVHKSEPCLSWDIHLDGRRCPGRNVWRLLYRRVPGGFLLMDIDNPHGPRG